MEDHPDPYHVQELNMRDVLYFLTFSKALAQVTTFTAGILSRPFVRSGQKKKAGLTWGEFREKDPKVFKKVWGILESCELTAFEDWVKEKTSEDEGHPDILTFSEPLNSPFRFKVPRSQSHLLSDPVER